MAKEKDKNTVFWGLGFISGTFKTIKQYSFKKVNDLKGGDKKKYLGRASKYIGKSR